MADMRDKVFTVKECMDQAINKLAEGGGVWDGVNPRELRGDLAWKTEKPTSPGWYWFILSDTPLVLRVRTKGGGLCAFFPVRGWVAMEEIEDSKWAGPIHPPQIDPTP